MKEDNVLCVCCRKLAVVVFHDQTALCNDHARIYQRIIIHEGNKIEIQMVD